MLSPPAAMVWWFVGSEGGREREEEGATITRGSKRERERERGREGERERGREMLCICVLMSPLRSLFFCATCWILASLVW
jgi:hypothetical protein